MPLLALGSTPPYFSAPQSHSIHTHGSFKLYFDKNAMVRDNSLCGSKITAVTAGGQRSSATIGGLILIETEQGDLQILGMTAGHFLAPNHNIGASEEEDQEEDGDEGEVDDDSDERSFDDVQEYELDLSLSGSDNLTRSVGHTHRHELPMNTGSIIGRIFRTSQESRQDDLNLDWVLFKIEDSSLYLPHIVAAREVTGAIHQIVIDTERGVVLSTATSGLLYAKLSSSASYLMLAPGNGMVKTHALKIFNNQAGDSVAWVIPLTNELYGHVVASDVFGIAYVTPIDDIFKDIKLRLSLKAIKVRNFSRGETLAISKKPTKYKVIGESCGSLPLYDSSTYTTLSLDIDILPESELS